LAEHIIGVVISATANELEGFCSQYLSEVITKEWADPLF
jgi:hypothetical protein